MRILFNHIFLFIIVAGFFLQGCSPSSKENDAPLVKTNYGNVSGNNEDGISIFKGIPYAKAERFMPPHEPDAWEGVRECSTYGPVAKQIVSWIADSLMNEKELFSLNVWTPGISDEKKSPVMLWLHGGGFHVGSSSDPMTAFRYAISIEEADKIVIGPTKMRELGELLQAWKMGPLALEIFEEITRAIEKCKIVPSS